MSATDTICASAGLTIFPSVGMTAIPSPMIFCENTGSGTSSNGTALPVSGDSINTFLPSSLLINCSLPDILLRPAFLLCPVSCFCKIVQPLALNIISLHCFFKCIFYIFQVFYFLHNLFCPVLCNFPVVLSTPEVSLLSCNILCNFCTEFAQSLLTRLLFSFKIISDDF